jgi:hypothetical protein
MKLLMRALFSLLFLTQAFRLNDLHRRKRIKSPLYGFAEWQDDPSSPTDLHLLAFPASEALIPGQSTTIVLKEGRFYDLMDDAIENHHSVIGMVLVGEDGIIFDGMPLCEIVSMEVKSGFRGKITIDMELESVGRAKLLELNQMKPTMMGSCIELVDNYNTHKVSDLEKSQDMLMKLEKMIKDLNGGSFNSGYESACQRAFNVTTREHGLGEGNSQLCELAAASWAILACLPERPSTIASKAIATTDIFQRLQLGAKAILEEQIKQTTSLAANEKEYIEDRDSGSSNFE